MIKKCFSHYARIITLFVLILSGGASSIRSQQQNTAALEKQISTVIDSMDSFQALDWMLENVEAYQKAHKIEETTCCYHAMLDLLQTIITQEAVFEATPERTSFYEIVTELTRRIKYFSVENIASHPHLSELIYRCELLSKSLLLSISSAARQIVMSCKNEILISNWMMIFEGGIITEHLRILNKLLEEDALEECRQKQVDSLQIAQLYTKIHAQKNILDSLSNMNAEIEFSILSKIIPEKKSQLSNHMSANLKKVKAQLNTKQAVIEYFTYENAAEKDCFGALIIRKQLKYPLFVEIGTTEEVIRLCQGKFNAHRFADMLWLKIDAHLAGCNELFLVPTGVLSTVPFSAFQLNKTYLAERYTIHTMLSSRDVVEWNPKRSVIPVQNALLIGGIDFDFGATKTEVTTSNPSLLRGARSMRGQGFGYLPWSLNEVSSVSELLSNKGWKVQTLIDTIASENSFRANLEHASPTIIHLSTHGFYIPDVSKETLHAASNDPMMRSGVLLAGANKTWGKKWDKIDLDYFEDGILSAKELLAMDLRNTHLMVLSACQTGLGDIESSEGVYGLLRAIKEAGARNILVSLWEIEDKETALIMNAFYRYLTNGMSCKQALDAAQADTRRCHPDQPHLWAGLVLVE